jgi:hypothetical protein
LTAKNGKAFDISRAAGAPNHGYGTQSISGWSVDLAAGSAVSATSANEAETSTSSRSENGAPLPKGGASLFARVNGIKMHYVSAGRGPNVVLLHGWPQTWFAWRNVMEQLSSRFTLIAPDLRGVRLTERPSSGYDKRTIAADIRALIDEAAGGHAHVVGHDMGGKAAFMLAHQSRKGGQSRAFSRGCDGL